MSMSMYDRKIMLQPCFQIIAMAVWVAVNYRSKSDSAILSLCLIQGLGNNYGEESHESLIF